MKATGCGPARAGLALFFVALWTLPLSAQNWPHWRGPDADGTSSQTGLPVEWSETRNIVWKLGLPAVSGSTPIIWGDVIFLNVGSGRDISLWAIDKGNHEQLAAPPRQRDAARAALEKRIADEVLEALHLHADGGLSSAQRIGGAGKILRIGYGDEAS